MAEDLIGYRGLVEKAYETLAPMAFRLVVRDAMTLAADRGLPGEHHFYITFRTHGEGVTVPASLRQRFPDDMTIVLQHQYWDLEVDDMGFSVMLKFGGLPQTLVVPYNAITRFVDPSVNALFLMEEPVRGDPDSDDVEYTALETIGTTSEVGRRPETGKTANAKAEAAKAENGKTKAEPQAPGDAPAGEAAGTVVRLDSFRRK